jgi:transcriptional regulator with XRE-family HTH domain
MSEDRKKRLGERIRRARQQTRMTQGQLAEKLRVSQGVISNVETGVSTIDVPELPRWAAALQKPLLYFYVDLDVEAQAQLLQINLDQEGALTPEVSEITLRAAQLSNKGQQHLLTVLKWIEAAEHQEIDNEKIREQE